MKLFFENRVAWEVAKPAEGGGVGGAQAVEAAKPAETADQKLVREKAEVNRNVLLEEIKLRKEILYKKLTDSFKGKEVMLDKEGFRTAFKKEVWNTAVAMDDELWKGVEVGFDESTDISQPDNVMAYFAKHGKKDEVLAEMFVTEVLAQVEKDGAITAAVTVTLQYDNGLKVTKVEKKAEDVKDGKEKKDQKEKKEEEKGPNYNAMAARFLNMGGVGKYVVTVLGMIGVIPSTAKEGESEEDFNARRRVAVAAGLKGEEPVTAWFCDFFGFKGGCEGSVKSLDESLAGTGWDGTYTGVKKSLGQYKDKIKEERDAVNALMGAPALAEAASEKVLAKAKASDRYETVPKGGNTFVAEELVSDKYDLEIIIPADKTIKVGGILAITEDGQVKPPYTAGQEIKASPDRNKVVVVAAGTPVPKDTILSEGVAYRYIPKKEATDTAAA